jgi:hypothetical protein
VKNNQFKSSEEIFPTRKNQLVKGVEILFLNDVFGSMLRFCKYFLQIYRQKDWIFYPKIQQFMQKIPIFLQKWPIFYTENVHYSKN